MRFAHNRDLIGSDSVIVAAIFLHVVEAGIFFGTSSANGSVGMAALLDVFCSTRNAAVVMLLACLLASGGQWLYGLRPVERLALLLPQQILLLITAFGAVIAIVNNSYADGVLRPWTFILCDQIPRLIAPVLYTVAMYARIKPVKVK